MTVDAELDTLFTPTEVSAYLNVPPGTLANWRYQGTGPPFIRVGRLVRYRGREVSAWLEENEQGVR